MKAKIDYRRIAINDICPGCRYYNMCLYDKDCAALEIVVKINEDVGSCVPDQ